MPTVIDRPQTIEKVDTNATKPLPRWILLLLKDENKDPTEIKEILQKAIPELGQIRIQKILDELKHSKLAIIWRGAREIVEHYEDLLRQHNLQVRIESEA